jgi:transcriptional accessory protein Tex/SPT6
MTATKTKNQLPDFEGQPVDKAAVKFTNHRADKDDDLVRVHTIKAEQISPIDGDSAEKFLQAYAEEVERKKSEIDGQMRLDEEEAALEREKADRRDSNMSSPA